MESDIISNRLIELEKRIEKLEGYISGLPSAGPIKGKKLSAKEFLLTKELKADTQKVLALGHFLERMEGMASFNVSDLEAAFRSAKEKLPKNMNDAVNKNVARGFIMEAEGKKDLKKAWVLTSTGERHVENEMKG
jgi:hypothetical protein